MSTLRSRPCKILALSSLDPVPLQPSSWSRAWASMEKGVHTNSPEEEEEEEEEEEDRTGLPLTGKGREKCALVLSGWKLRARKSMGGKGAGVVALIALLLAAAVVKDAFEAKAEAGAGAGAWIGEEGGVVRSTMTGGDGDVAGALVLLLRVRFLPRPRLRSSSSSSSS